MTIRAVIIGLLLSVLLASFGYINDVWFFFSYIGGDLIPTFAFGLLLLGLLVVNPLLRAVRFFQFRPGEWATILAMMFMGSVIAGSAMLWQFPHPWITPVYEAPTKPGWVRSGLIDYFPAPMLVENVYERYAARHGIERKTVSVKDGWKQENWREAIERELKQQKPAFEVDVAGEPKALGGGQGVLGRLVQPTTRLASVFRSRPTGHGSFTCDKDSNALTYRIETSTAAYDRALLRLADQGQPIIAELAKPTAGGERGGDVSAGQISSFAGTLTGQDLSAFIGLASRGKVVLSLESGRAGEAPLQGPLAPPLTWLDKKNSQLLSGYWNGLPRAKDASGGRDLLLVGDVPWEQWRPTLVFWFALLALSFIGGIASVVIVHRQWSKREHLAYPTVIFANELIASDHDIASGQPLPAGPLRPFNPIFRNKLFWAGFGVSFVILMINGYQAWFPGFVSIPTGIDARSVGNDIEWIRKMLEKVNVGRNVLNVRFYFAAVGLAYFLTSEASFSMGISGWLFILAAAPLVAMGVDMRRDMLEGGLPNNMYFGAYVGMGITVLYLGRHYYRAVLKRAFCLPDKSGDVMPYETWATRIFLLANAGMVLLLWQVLGLHWLLGILFVLLTNLLFLMLGRINVATGLFVVQPNWQPVGVMLAFFGISSLGPSSLAILAFLCTVVSIDTRIAAVPLVLNALKLGELQKVKPGRLGGAMGLAVVVSTIVAVLFTVWLVYNTGVTSMGEEGTNWALTVARMPFEMVQRNVDKLESMDLLSQSNGPMDLSRLAQAKPVPYFLPAIGVGAALVLICSWLRLRFPRWPLHPLMFLVWGQPWMVEYAPSFLLAWFLKGLIMRYGGQRSYRTAKPAFVGLVAGEFLAALIWAVVGVVYYQLTGTLGESFMTRE